MQDPKRIKSLMRTKVRADLVEYFTELFTEIPGLLSVTLTEEQLLSDMEARFKGTYDPKAIAALLSNGFEEKPGTYVFNRADFINPVKNRLEGVVL